MSAPFVIEARDLQCKRGETTVLAGASFAASGGVTALLGPSGAGKSSVLRAVVGLLPIWGGTLRIGTSEATWERGVPIGAGSARIPTRQERARLAAVRREVGMVFQALHLFPHRTALGNVVEGPVTVQGMGRSEAEQRALALLDRVGLAPKRSAYPSELSGGEQQRLAIARALALGPRALLLDEPTSALDPARSRSLSLLLRGMADEGMTLVVVTHDIPFARAVADRIVVLCEGAVVEEGAADDIMERPHHSVTRALLRHSTHDGDGQMTTGE